MEIIYMNLSNDSFRQSVSTGNVIDVPITEPDKIFKLIDPAKPLVYYTHGYVEHPSNESVQTIVEGK